MSYQESDNNPQQEAGVERLESKVPVCTHEHRPMPVPSNRPALAELLAKYDNEFHPAAKLLPSASAEDFDRHLAWVALNGQFDDIILHEGKIVDGRHLFIILKILGLEPRFAPLRDGVDPVKFSLGRNLAGRQLTQLQKAAVAVECKDQLSPQARERQRQAGGCHEPTPLPDNVSGSGGQNRHDRESTTVAAKLTGAGIRATQQLSSIRSKAPAVFDAAKSGVLRSVAQAMIIARMNAVEQAMALQNPDGIHNPRRAKVEPELRPTSASQSSGQEDRPSPRTDLADVGLPDANEAPKTDVGAPGMDPVLSLVRQYVALSLEDQQRFRYELGISTPIAEGKATLGLTEEAASTGTATDGKPKSKTPDADALRSQLKKLIANGVTSGSAIAKMLKVHKTSVSQFKCGKKAAIGQDNLAKLATIVDKLSS